MKFQKRIRGKLMEIWDLKLTNFFKEIYARKQAVPPVINFFVKTGKFGAHSFMSLRQILEVPRIVTKLDMINRAARHIFYWNEKYRKK